MPRLSRPRVTARVVLSWLAAAGLAAAAVAAMPAHAEAMSCAPAALNQLVRSVDGIIEGTVVSVTPLPPPVLRDGMIVAGANLASIELSDVRALTGVATSRLVSGHDWVRPGYRYIFATRRHPDGHWVADTCGLVRTASRAAAFRAWLRSLTSPPAGGRIFGAVLVRPWGTQDLSEWPGVPAATVVVRGPVERQGVTGDTGEFTIGGLPDGDYTVELRAPGGRTDVTLPAPMRVALTGDYAAASLDLFADVNGTIEGVVVDEAGQPVAHQQLRLHAGPTADSSANGILAFLKTDADGRYRGTSLAPGRYLLSILDPFVIAHAASPTGGHEIVAGWADHITLPPFVVRRGELVDVQVLVTDPAGVPLEEEVRVELVGEYGPIPLTGHHVRTSRSGAFPEQLVRGNRYRFTLGRPQGQAPVSVDHRIDGTTIRLVAPPR